MYTLAKCSIHGPYYPCPAGCPVCFEEAAKLFDIMNNRGNVCKIHGLYPPDNCPKCFEKKLVDMFENKCDKHGSYSGSTCPKCNEESEKCRKVKKDSKSAEEVKSKIKREYFVYTVRCRCCQKETSYICLNTKQNTWLEFMNIIQDKIQIPRGYECDCMKDKNKFAIGDVISYDGPHGPYYYDEKIINYYGR